VSAAGFLSSDDLRTLTNCARQPAQEEWLRAEGIRYKLSRKGELLVCWKHVHDWIDGRPAVATSVAPDLSRVC
jgi:hypothetical protein